MLTSYQRLKIIIRTLASTKKGEIGIKAREISLFVEINFKQIIQVLLETLQMNLRASN